MSNRVPAEVFPPGEFIRDELEARGWTQQDLADILGRPLKAVSEILAGKRAVTADTAKGLGEAFEVDPQFWMNLESAYGSMKKHGRSRWLCRACEQTEASRYEDFSSNAGAELLPVLKTICWGINEILQHVKSTPK